MEIFFFFTCPLLPARIVKGKVHKLCAEYIDEFYQAIAYSRDGQRFTLFEFLNELVSQSIQTEGAPPMEGKVSFSFK